MKPVYIAKGSNGTVSVYPTKVVLKYSTFLGSGKGEKEIRLSSITGIQLKKPGFTAGYIQFSFPGSKEVNGRRIMEAVKDENTVMAGNKSQYEQMVKAKTLIEEYQNDVEVKEPQSPLNPSSVADEIKKLAELRDSGILTEEEFSAKKKQLLGI
jgi:Short C-terminal domain